jgi:hypothetical protein
MRRQVISFDIHVVLIAMIVLALAGPVSAEQNRSTTTPSCEPMGSLVRVPELREGSGVAASRQSPGRVWAHNDSGEPVLVALDTIVTPKGDILIVTKGDTGPVGLYRLPSDAKPGGTVTLQPVGKPRQGGKVAADERVTDGAVSPSGVGCAEDTRGGLPLSHSGPDVRQLAAQQEVEFSVQNLQPGIMLTFLIDGRPSVRQR